MAFIHVESKRFRCYKLQTHADRSLSHPCTEGLSFFFGGGGRGRIAGKVATTRDGGKFYNALKVVTLYLVSN